MSQSSNPAGKYLLLSSAFVSLCAIAGMIVGCTAPRENSGVLCRSLFRSDSELLRKVETAYLELRIKKRNEPPDLTYSDAPTHGAWLGEYSEALRQWSADFAAAERRRSLQEQLKDVLKRSASKYGYSELKTVQRDLAKYGITGE
jgi:hypothetical protein